jgi:hypothetical protein
MRALAGSSTKPVSEADVLCAVASGKWLVAKRSNDKSASRNLLVIEISGNSEE